MVQWNCIYFWIGRVHYLRIDKLSTKRSRYFYGTMNCKKWDATNKSQLIFFLSWRQLQGIVLNPYCTVIHTFSAFWLRSSVVSVLISVKAGFRLLADVFFTFIFELPDCAACRQRLGRSPGAFTFPPWGQQNFCFNLYFHVVLCLRFIQSLPTLSVFIFAH